jgi:diadenylate cyclase
VHHLLSVAGTVRPAAYGIARLTASVLPCVGNDRYDRLEAVFGRVCESVACSSARRRTLEEVVELAVEIAREGREGRKIGTLFVVGDSENVLVRSRPLILDPLHGHAEELLHVSRPEFRETIKELAQLDGAFLVEDDGTFRAAARFVDVDVSAPDVFLPGLGTRHAAAASISGATRAVSVVVSQSSVVRVFANGHVRAEVIPELFLLSRERLYAENAEVETLPQAGITLAVSAAPAGA